ncbi:DegT/DnrJ/EryC1/StrS aminotransferase family protein [Halobacterium sp. CBA1126]|uniref:DegT/DnrJ/EryC1/StrS family aminotransferase n=1 Tax=Halobacterium sp. CBA1126 TaxID=2668074 RepID=UPI0012F803C4|nr:DegT/DnrJ/EryC1/StrS family aminotransferase [Halobacterium sp. CBA1126]MUV59837.1 aminotransferase class I/II-fold pyridoxal phosphate-dependent enzyme [Halobacterium sp. CBA1126]
MVSVPLYKPENVIGDEVIDGIRDVLASGWLTLGPKTRSFEDEFSTAHSSEHGIAVNSCTSALYTCLRTLGVGDGDTVVVPAMTFSATANVVRLLDANVVLCDVTETGNMDPESLARQLERYDVAAVIPVHLYGLPADMPEICRLADEHGAAVIEDCAHAPGASIAGEPVGSFGDAGCYSFYATKNMTTGEGGMVVTNDDSLADRVRKLRNHHQTKSPDEKQDNWGYDVDGLGFNFRMSEIQAVMGRSQLERLPEMNDNRREVAQQYLAALEDIPGLEWVGDSDSFADHVFHLFVVRVTDDYPLTRQSLYNHLSTNDIVTGVHYPPISELSYYGDVCGNHDTADDLYDEILSLPMFPRMTDTEQETVIAALRSAANE